jgi:hypothetical protein
MSQAQTSNDEGQRLRQTATANGPGATTMFKVLILICSMNMAPADCQLNTAITVINGPDAYDESACGLFGQAYIAQTALGDRRHDDEYVKVKCTTTTIGKTVG